jgi:hypothetical protein
MRNSYRMLVGSGISPLGAVLLTALAQVTMPFIYLCAWWSERRERSARR